MKASMIRLLSGVLSIAGIFLVMTEVIELQQRNDEAIWRDCLLIAGAAYGAYMFGRFALRGNRDPLSSQL